MKLYTPRLSDAFCWQHCKWVLSVKMWLLSITLNRPFPRHACLNAKKTRLSSICYVMRGQNDLNWERELFQKHSPSPITLCVTKEKPWNGSLSNDYQVAKRVVRVSQRDLNMSACLWVWESNPASVPTKM